MSERSAAIAEIAGDDRSMTSHELKRRLSRLKRKRRPTAFEPRIVAFVCNWCTYAGADLAGTSRLHYAPNVRIIKLPCTGPHRPAVRPEGVRGRGRRRPRQRLPPRRLPLHQRQLPRPPAVGDLPQPAGLHGHRPAAAASSVGSRRPRARSSPTSSTTSPTKVRAGRPVRRRQPGQEAAMKMIEALRADAAAVLADGRAKLVIGYRPAASDRACRSSSPTPTQAGAARLRRRTASRTWPPTCASPRSADHARGHRRPRRPSCGAWWSCRPSRRSGRRRRPRPGASATANVPRRAGPGGRGGAPEGEVRRPRARRRTLLARDQGTRGHDARGAGGLLGRRSSPSAPAATPAAPPARCATARGASSRRTCRSGSRRPPPRTATTRGTSSGRSTWRAGAPLCGACEAACPQGIPLMLLNAMLAEEVAEEFGAKAGLRPRGQAGHRLVERR